MKNTLKLALMALVMAFCLPALVHAEDAAQPAEDTAIKAPKEKKKAKKELVDVALEGKLTKEERGEGDKKKVSFLLTDAEGNKYPLRQPKAKKPKKPKKKKAKDGDAPAEGAAEEVVEEKPAQPVIDLNSFVDRDIKITAKAHVMEKGGKKRTMVRQIVAVEPL